MFIRRAAVIGFVATAALTAAYFGRPQADGANAVSSWEKLHDAGGLAVYRSPTSPAAYLLVAGEKAVLIDAPAGPELLLKDNPPAKPTTVLLTHHHRDSVAGAAAFVAAKTTVKAPKLSQEWLSTENVAKFWKESIPLRNSRTAYFMVPEGIDGLDYSLIDGSKITLGEWTITAIAAPGHSKDHLAFAVAKTGDTTGPLLFCGDAITGGGKLWTPYTTDWDHWTDAGLKPATESLRKLAALKPTKLFPARGPIVADNAAGVLERTAILVEEAGFQKSFERFTNRLGNPPKYDFLVPKEQIASGGDKPWHKVSEHLWITGNTYVLVSKQEKACLVLDPWGQRSIDQVEKLRKDEKFGPIERVVFSHAHYDHFDGVYDLPGKETYKVWALDIVAEPLIDPLKLRAPFLDARPIVFDKVFRDKEATTWREYGLTFHALPGQTAFTCGIETIIDGKRCLFTADNFFHQNQFSGSGGWMGLNRSSPAVYGQSAKKVLDLAPEWVLAEHGGPYVFDAEDYRRRVKWGEAAGLAADAICVSGRHRDDWNPHRVSVEPVMVTAKPGANVKVTVRVTNAGSASKVTVVMQGRSHLPNQTLTLDVPTSGTASQELAFAVPVNLKPGRYVFAVCPTSGEFADPFFAIDITP